MGKLIIASILEMVGYTAKRSEIWDSWVVCHIYMGNL